MLREDTKIKVGIYTSGSSIRIIGECDLIEQEGINSYQDAIYMVEVSMMRDPRIEMTESEIQEHIKHMVRNFEMKQFQFKVASREQADAFVKTKIDKWDVVRPLSEV